MRVDVWKSTVSGNSFLFVREGVSPEVVVNPDALTVDMKGLRLFRRSVELDNSPGGINIDEVAVSRDLAQRGYALHLKNPEPG